MRGDFMELLLACLESQVGVEVVREEDLARARLDHEGLHIGRCRYRMLLAPSVTVLEATTWRALQAAVRASIPVHSFGAAPRFLKNEAGVKPAPRCPWPVAPLDAAREWLRAHTPTPLPLGAQRGHHDLRATVWRKDGERRALLMNLGRRPLRVAPLALTLAPNELAALAEEAGSWNVRQRFDPADLPPCRPEAPELPLTDWAIRWPGEQWARIPHPIACYVHRPVYRNPREMITMVLTPPVPVEADPLAKWVDYRATVRAATAREARRARLRLEPTSLRGRVVVGLNGQRWPCVLRDLDTEAVVLSIGNYLRPGANRLTFRFLAPQPLDGIKAPLRILI
jgi:hypothetical protein